MVVNNLHLLWSSVCPPEADPPLAVDPDAGLTSPVNFQRVEPVPRRNAEILDRLRGSHLAKLAEGGPKDP